MYKYICKWQYFSCGIAYCGNISIGGQCFLLNCSGPLCVTYLCSIAWRPFHCNCVYLSDPREQPYFNIWATILTFLPWSLPRQGFYACNFLFIFFQIIVDSILNTLYFLYCLSYTFAAFSMCCHSTPASGHRKLSLSIEFFTMKTNDPVGVRHQWVVNLTLATSHDIIQGSPRNIHMVSVHLLCCDSELTGLSISFRVVCFLKPYDYLRAIKHLHPGTHF